MSPLCPYFGPEFESEQEGLSVYLLSFMAVGLDLPVFAVSILSEALGAAGSPGWGKVLAGLLRRERERD